MSKVELETLKLEQFKTRLEYLYERGIDIEERVISIHGVIDSKTAKLIDFGMTILESVSKGAITIRIHSEGGSFYDSLAVVGRLTSSKCKIITEGCGCVMSAACMIFACGKTRKVSEFCQFMLHESIYETGERKHYEHKSIVSRAEEEEIVYSKWLARFSFKSPKFWRNKLNGKEFYIEPATLLKYGLADEIF